MGRRQSQWGFSSPTAPESEWRLRALCRSHDPRMWDLPAADEKTPETAYRNEMAKRICRGCPVKVPCGDEALERRETGVIRAGVKMPSSNSPEKWTRALAALARRTA